jgi:hypothetical protein
MINHEDNPVRISRIITQKCRTSYGMQWAEAYRVSWTDPANGSSLVRMVGSLADAKRLKREIQGKNTVAA